MPKFQLCSQDLKYSSLASLNALVDARLESYQSRYLKFLHISHCLVAKKLPGSKLHTVSVVVLPHI